ncbi:M20/M25/M40 family metallo-hydrolase [Ichthyenterobacterium magnum]|uniref:Vacuolar membrane protease n=1 Tax=Ichthyenterobacterium magnum TaxID=1230530 RepID=A0A420DXN1_9FLAO|nr:M20/M25/M40 family metallo-hydrolase [Ichthyenterobacterium magnum]RKE98973.1 peptidase M28-like protein [Ichthyenterobacterium magnum]
MLKKAITLALIIIAVYWSFSALMPNKISSLDADTKSFSTERALVHLKEISKQPHYVGSKNHASVKEYIVKELENLGLEVQLQENYSFNRKWESFTKPTNILARIKGSDNTKALVLLTHYDSNAHSSFGASDAGSGVVTILEGLRAFLSQGVTPKNDIIILITDAEESGLNGADIFVNKHPWAKNIGLVLNFEARGSGGPSYMLVETNGGNHNMIEAFKKANPKFPVANSLAYSIYKMLPNDTDLTRFREDGDIEGFNFAFIDDHFDYHTALDTYERLDRETLEHQASYLMPLLDYFSKANLNNLKSDDDDIYFNVPLFKTVSYPFSWILPMLILSFIVFFVLIYYGIKKQTLNPKHIGLGFAPLFLSLIINGLIGFLGWKVLSTLYPRYNEVLHGFTYNGHTYIWAFSFLAIAICFLIYHKFYKPKNAGNLLIAPLFLWLVICTLIALKLKGASFFIIPVIFGLISLFVLVRQEKPSPFLMVLLGVPVLVIMSPFVKMFPVGLGLGILVASTVLITLIYSLLVSIFNTFQHKKRWSYALFFIAFCCFVSAHLNSKFTNETPKPNSLVYVLDLDTNSAIWATYDNILDQWTEHYLSDNPDSVRASNDIPFKSKYGTGFTFSKNAAIKNIDAPLVEITKDTIIGDDRHIRISLVPQRFINRIDVFSDSRNVFKSFNINGLEVAKKDNETSIFNNRKTNRLFGFYLANQEPLNLSVTVPKSQKTEFQFYEASYDLLENNAFKIKKRATHMIPKPFVLNDAIIIKKTITIE